VLGPSDGPTCDGRSDIWSFTSQLGQVTRASAAILAQVVSSHDACGFGLVVRLVELPSGGSGGAIKMPRRRIAVPDPFLENTGPQDLLELSRWDDFIVRRLHHGGLAGRCAELLSKGVVMYSDYSGIDFPREAVRVFVPAFFGIMGLPCPSVEHVRSCDWGKVQIYVLKRSSRLLGASRSCVFGDMSERLPKELQEWLDAATPGPKSTSDVVSLSNQAIEEHMTRIASWAFPRCSTSYCYVHERRCPSYPASAYGDTHSAFFLELPNEQPLKKALRRNDSDASASSRNCVYETWWAERRVAPVAEDGSPERPLMASIAGLTCTDWTSLGKQMRRAGSSDRYHSTYIEERRALAKQNLEDIFITECAERYSAEVMQREKLADTHHVVIVRFGPQEMGFPIRRRRTFTSGLNRETLVWIGPTDPGDVQREFDELFTRTVELTGDAFFVADEADVLSWVRDRSAKRKSTLPPDWKTANMSTYFHMLVPPGGVRRKAVYDHLRKSEGSLTGAFLCDIEQNSHMGSVPGPIVPALNTHSDIFSYESNRFATRVDYLAMLGIDSHVKVCGRRGVSPLTDVFKKLDEADVRLLVGNGIHVPVIAAWFAYVMGNTIRREHPRVHRPLAPGSEEDEI